MQKQRITTIGITQLVYKIDGTTNQRIIIKQGKYKENSFKFILVTKFREKTKSLWN